MTTTRRDPRVDPRPGDILELDGQRFEVVRRCPKWVETAGPPICPGDSGYRCTAVRFFTLAMQGAEVIRAAQAVA